MKKLSILLVLVVALGIALPTFAAPTIGGDIQLSATMANDTDTDFGARLRLKISGSVSDEIAYAVRLKASGALEGIKGVAPGIDYAYLTFGPEEIPAKVEAGLLSFGTSPLMIYGNAFSGSQAGVRVIPALPGGLSAWALVVPDYNNGTPKNEVLYAGSLGQGGSFGSVSGILFKKVGIDGLGWSVQGQINAPQDGLVLYGEYGKSDPNLDEANIKVVGAYLPLVSKTAGFDPYLEYDIENELFGAYVKKAFDNKLTLEVTAKQAIVGADKKVQLTTAVSISF